ncbi:MAG: metal-dependent hydrolase [Gammaproteobacteria bacterium]|nr:metal-dependent hydrolase [Planctomycetaceae bacterium]MCP5347487.1 metal-dependent hydrolase [Pseudomonadales bacterium]
MPFTPFHMGPGLLIKSVLQGSFSLMVFGWTQVVMDLQPLIVMITGEGHLHGFTHTFPGAALIALVSALTGKYLSEYGLRILGVAPLARLTIRWWVAIVSAFIGSFSHVVLDAVMHGDVQPFYPASLQNPLLGNLSVEALHKLCLYSGLVGAGLYYAVRIRLGSKQA